MKIRPASVYILLTLAALAFFSGIYLKSTDTGHSSQTAPDIITHYQGHAYYFELPSSFTTWSYIRPDSSQKPASSLLRVEIDGVKLSPHQTHSDLMAGKHGFSHWQKGVVFSIGTADPREIVQSIIITHPFGHLEIVISISFVIMLLLTYLNNATKFKSILTFLYECACIAIWKCKMILIFLHTYANYVGWCILTTYAGLIIITIWTGYPEFPVVGLDALYGYIPMAKKVPIGYPAFILFISFLFPGLKAVIVAQVILYCASVLIFYWQASKSFYTPYIALVIGILLLGAGRVMTYNLVIGADGILASILILHMAAVLAIMRTFSTQAMVMAGITVAIAIFVRPAAYFLVGGLAVLFIFLHGHRIRFITTSGASLMVLFLLFSQITTYIHGKDRMSLLGLALFPHVMHLFDASEMREHKQDAFLVEAAISEYKLKMQQVIPVAWDTAYELEMNNFNPVSDKIHEALYQGIEKNDHRFKEILFLFEKFAIETVLKHPYGYLEIVMINLYGSYSRNILLVTPPGYANYEGASFIYWLEQTRENALSGFRYLGLPMPDIEKPLQSYDFIATPPVHLDLLQYLSPGMIYILGIAVSILLAGVLTPLRYEPVQLFGIYVLILHLGGTMLVCLSTVAIPRYSVPLDVLLLVSIGCAMNILILCLTRTVNRVYPAKQSIMKSKMT